MAEIVTTKGDDGGTIDSLISYLEESKKRGATNYSIRFSGPSCTFKWFETYRNKSEKKSSRRK